MAWQMQSFFMAKTEHCYWYYANFCLDDIKQVMFCGSDKCTVLTFDN